MLDQLAVPQFARLTDYAGVWAIEPTAAAAMWSRAQSTDLPKHVAETQPPKLKADVIQTVKASNGQRVAVVMLTGTLMKAVSSMDGGTSTVKARREIRAAVADQDVSAVVLAIDSPGGTVAGTADLAQEVLNAKKKKPVVAFVSDLGASAAYWVASQADAVFANNATALVGSIGTLAVVYDMSGKAEKDGIKTLVFGTGPLKGAGAPGAPVSEAQQDYFRAMVEDSQKSFDAAVRKGREMTDARLEKVKTGGVFGATEAESLGLIDGIKSFEQAVEEAAAMSRRMKREQNASNRAESPTQVLADDFERNLNRGSMLVCPPGTKITQTRANGPTTPVRTAQMDETVSGGAVVADAPKIDIQAEIAEFRKAKAAEMQRVAGIEKAAAGHADIIAEAIAGGWTPDQAELKALKAGLSSNVRPFNPAIVSRGHEKDCTRDALAGALLLRSGVKLDARLFASDAGFDRFPSWLRADINDPERNRLMDGAHKFKHLSAIDLARECVRLDGKEVPYDRDAMLQAAFSGGTLTNIFTTSVNAQLLGGYMQAPDTTGGWTQTTDVADFKTNERPRLQTLGNSMKKLPRGSEADHEERSDQAESYKIFRYASQYVVDEQDFIDDSLNALDSMPGDMGQKAARLRPDLVYYILLANPTLAATSRALFNTTDGNLGSSAALNSANLKAAISAFTLVRENNVNLNLTPTHLIVPTSLKFTAKELVNSAAIIIAGTAGSVTERGTMNTLQDENLQWVQDARLENGVVDPDTGTTGSGSASTWFLASTMAKTIEVAYRRGTGRAPQVRSFTLDKGKWGMGWDINMDIGAKAMDWHGMRKTTA